MNTLKEFHREDNEIEKLKATLKKAMIELKAVALKADKVSKLELALEKSRATSDKHYYGLVSARKTIERLKGHKQSVLKAVTTLILDDKLVMTDSELEERYFVDIGNIVNTRSAIKRARK